MRRVNSQMSLELAVVFVSAALFFFGITRVWVWSNSQLVGRTPAYNRSRLAAGSSNPGFWGQNNEGVYTPKELNDEWIFAANPYAGDPGGVHLPGSSTRLGYYGGNGAFNFPVDIGNYDYANMDCGMIASNLTMLYDIRAQVSNSTPAIDDELAFWDSNLIDAGNGASARQSEINNLNTAIGEAQSCNFQNLDSYCLSCGLGSCGTIWWCDTDLRSDLLSCLNDKKDRARDGYMKVPFRCYWGDSDCDGGTAYGSPCYSGCTACGDTGNCSWCTGISSPYSTREEMVKGIPVDSDTKTVYGYYEWRRIIESLTDQTSKEYMYDNYSEYKFHLDSDSENPYGSSCTCGWWWWWGQACGKPTYVPGLLDYQEREAYAQSMYDELLSASDETSAALDEIDAQIATLEGMQVDLGC